LYGSLACKTRYRHYQSHNVVHDFDDESGVDWYGRTPLAVRVDDCASEIYHKTAGATREDCMYVYSLRATIDWIPCILL
jgi:hypothetical protein